MLTQEALGSSPRPILTPPPLHLHPALGKPTFMLSMKKKKKKGTFLGKPNVLYIF